MKVMKTITKKCAGFLAAVMVILAGVWTAAVPAEAASGNVYTCAVHPCYVHPVTGVIEDSGGEASYATGQGMVDGVVYPTGILELTDSGEYYLTVRFSLMDQTSGHSFWVQNVGDSGWSAPAAGVTGSGTDGNGTTADICIQVPSENCVVRVSMYVDPMGRDGHECHDRNSVFRKRRGNGGQYGFRKRKRRSSQCGEWNLRFARRLCPEWPGVISLRLFRYGDWRQQYGSACTVQFH